MKTFGVVLRRGKGVPFETLVEDACASGATPKGTVLTLLSVYRDLKRQIAAFDRELRCYVRTSEVCRRLMTIPGIGPLTAVAFVTAVDDPSKFANHETLGRILG